MKVLFFSTVHPSRSRPTKGTFNRTLLHALRMEGHDIRAVIPVPWQEAGLSRLTQSETEAPARFWYIPSLFGRWLHVFLWYSIRPTIRRVIQDWRPDVVVGYWSHPDGTVARRIAQTLQVPYIQMVGGTDVNIISKDPGRRPLIAETLIAADRVVTIGEALGGEVQLLGVPRDNVVVFQRGIRSGTFFKGDRAEARARLHLPAGESILLWVGRMVAVKGLSVLIDALARLKSEATPSLYLIGGGPEERALRHQVTYLGLDGQVTFVGRVGHEALGDWYRAANLVVLPSQSEGVPNVLLEGLGCGIPFVASAVGGIPALAESPGWLVPPNDPAALAEAIGRELRSPSLVLNEAVDDRGAARRFAAMLAETVAVKSP